MDEHVETLHEKLKRQLYEFPQQEVAAILKKDLQALLAEREDYVKQGRDLEDLAEQRDVVLCREADLKAERDRLRADLNNLLAIIHRDGGHHTEEVGTRQSVADAHRVWAGLQEEVAWLRAALRELRRNPDECLEDQPCVSHLAYEDQHVRIEAALAEIEGHRKAGERNASLILRSIERALKGEEGE
jgi:hypothetical protein